MLTVHYKIVHLVRQLFHLIYYFPIHLKIKSTLLSHAVNSEGGELNTPSSFVLNSNWETVFFNSTAGKSFEIEFWINRPSHSADKVSSDHFHFHFCLFSFSLNRYLINF